MKILFFIFLSLFLVSCQETKSVEFYKANPELAKEKTLKCKKYNLISQDCINAYKIAIEKEEWKSKLEQNISKETNSTF
ncbi:MULTISPECIES: EexN family lipoprotein [unclassified Campylobacter]|uniref:EexN family lipoprotein n=1 Tax=unclassified Campylobacter TaxID=2593542 RepID=UPI001237F0DD|nr:MULTISPECIES: EexN family lipoprotein [unclassified Campylobacter]KAA6226386.1 hypothetical protein FMM57_06275 [Campylobacter sp. LR286c]KAA6226576.1 hypothetical protein FMM54_03960 [Campylobacter sp. LR185c]KAA6226877.1 hypothetical protein FMM55_04840 [Campylobacter sp. LR196d]KAA6230315.1 hypothetical protein FMM58_06475 [Campylobacter sp. LR291e]KAA8603618.1 hypothetical protein CGP82_06400 [Campylobacter sp. LR185c]